MMTHNWDKDALEVVKVLSRNERDRLRAILAMHTLVIDMNDETAYMTWIYLVPDGANEWDFLDFARNDDGTETNHFFDEAVVLFKKLWKRYAAEDKGLYIGEQTY